MTRRSRLWRTAAGLFVVINVLGGAYAVVMGEVPHAVVHVVLVIVGAGVWARFGSARGGAGAQWGDMTAAATSPELTDRFRNLEQSIDAVAIEVERIGEGQRFMTGLLLDRAPPDTSPDERAAPGTDTTGQSSS